MEDLFDNWDWDEDEECKQVMCRNTFINNNMFIKGNWYSYREWGNDHYIFVNEHGEDILWHKSKIEYNFKFNNQIERRF